MSFSIKLYQISAPDKKITKTAGASQHEREITGVLYEEVEDICAPVIELDSSILTAPTDHPTQCTFWTCNYAYIPTMGRYYFITGKTIVDNDHLLLYLRVDVLRTYSGSITGTTAWISRSASAGSWYLPDGLVPISAEARTSYNKQFGNYPGETSATYQPISPTKKPSNDETHVRFVISVAGGVLPSGSSYPVQAVSDATLINYPYGSSIYYGMTLGTLMELAKAIVDDSIASWFSNAKESIFSVHALPFDLDPNVYSVSSMWMGNSTEAINCWQLTKVFHDTHCSKPMKLSLPDDFRISTGTFKIRVYLPCVGWTELDPAVVKAKGPYMYVSYKTNILTGATLVSVYLTQSVYAFSALIPGDLVATHECNVARTIPLTTSTAAEIARGNASAILSTALSMGAAIATENPAIIAGALAGAAGTAANRATMKPSYSQIGSFTGAETMDLYPGFEVFVQYTNMKSDVLDDDSMKNMFAQCHGLRCDKAMLVSGNTGFIKCANWWMNTPSGATDQEVREIKSLMESGVIV